VQNQSNPHGRFLRSLLSHQKTAQVFFSSVIAENMRNQLDISSIEICRDQFLDDDLDYQLSDILFRVNRSDLMPAFIYLLFQKKGNPEPLMSYLLFRYMERIWEQTINQGMIGHLPLIIPIVLFNGTSQWSVSNQFAELFGKAGGFSSLIPDFQYIASNLNQITKDTLDQSPTLSVGLHVLKAVNESNFQEKLPSILSPLNNCQNNNLTRRFLSNAIEFICAASNITQTDLESIIDETLSVEKNTCLSVYDQLYKQGMVHQAREAIFDVLNTRFASISSDTIETIQAIDEVEIMKILHKQSVTSVDLVEFEEMLEMMLF